MNPRKLFPRSPERSPTLTFAPSAFLKLQWFCHFGDTEIAGFGIARPDSPLYIAEFVTVPQEATAVSFRFDDTAIADYFDRCVDRGLQPPSFARIWLHTHPSASVTPSDVDEATFARCFGGCDWAIMFILGRTGRTYARLAYHVGPHTALEIPVTVDWSYWPACLEMCGDNLRGIVAEWQREYTANIRPPRGPAPYLIGLTAEELLGHGWWQDEPGMQPSHSLDPETMKGESLDEFPYGHS